MIHCLHPAQTPFVPVAFPPVLLRCRGPGSCVQGKSFVNRYFFQWVRIQPFNGIHLKYSKEREFCSDFKGKGTDPCETGVASTINITKYRLA